MKAKKWIPDRHVYIDIDVDDHCACYSVDMEEIIVCPSCGKKFIFGDGYCSLEYFTENGIWAMSVCPECYSQEIRTRRKNDN